MTLFVALGGCGCNLEKSETSVGEREKRLPGTIQVTEIEVTTIETFQSDTVMNWYPVVLKYFEVPSTMKYHSCVITLVETR